MTRILVVRHGQDTDNANGILNGRRDTELTALGRHQAKVLAQKLKTKGVRAVYTSPLKRAYETASIIAHELGIPKIISEEDLIEREFGILTGTYVADIPKLTEKVLVGDHVNYFLDVKGAENYPALLERARNVFHKIQEKHPHETVLVVTHGDIGKMICAAYHNWGWEKGLKTPYFENAGVLELADAQ